MENLQYNKTGIKDIAKFQKLICWLFLIMIIGLIFPIITLGANIVAIFCVYYLARALKVNHPGLYVLGVFIPIVSLFVLLNVIQKSTKVLRSQNIKVGVMGANKKDLNKFLNSI